MTRHKFVPYDQRLGSVALFSGSIDNLQAAHDEHKCKIDKALERVSRAIAAFGVTGALVSGGARAGLHPTGFDPTIAGETK
jgi:hypothetical protein